MTQYNTFHKKLSNSQLNKLKSGIKNGTQVTINLSSNVIGDSPYKLSLTNTQVSKIRKAFLNGNTNTNTTANKKFSSSFTYALFD